MNHPFDNDLFALMYEEFEKIYPDHPGIVVQWAPQEEFDDYDSDGDVNGLCEWRNDGSIVVSISLSNTVEEALRVLAHELTHVGIGYDHDHDDTFKAMNKKLRKAFERRLEEEYGDDD